MLELKNICYTVSTPETGEQTILKDISVTIPDGKLIVFTGPNGGGKTTLAKVIMGLVTPTSGQILWNGEDITALDITERARSAASATASSSRPRFKGMTVRDLLQPGVGRSKLSTEEACRDTCHAGGPVRAGLYRPGGGRHPVRRRAQADRDRHGACPQARSCAIFDEPEAGIDLWSFARSDRDL